MKLGSGLNMREHWRKRAKRVKGERTVSKMAVMANGMPELPVEVTMTRLSSGRLDDDNLQGAFKAVRDGIADAYGIPDNDPRLVWLYGQEKCRRGDFGVRIVLRAIS